MPHIDIRNVDVIAPNFKRRLSGVTSTIIQLLPVQTRLGLRIAALGPGLPARLPHIRFRDLIHLWRAPEGRRERVWHARRNIEMLPAIVLRDVFRMKLKIAFTSASQRKHSGWTKFLVGRMDAVIATSRRTASYLTVPNSVVMHGIDTDRFSPPPSKNAARGALGLHPAWHYVGCFGRVRHQKGTDLFVDTMIRLLPTRPDWCAIVAGRATGPHVEFETNLKERVKAAGLSDRILFVGEHTEINEWYRALDLFIAPQRWEGFGLTPLEAMASGVPVVATDVGAFSELLITGENQTGWLISANDLDAMIETTAPLLDNVELVHAAGERGRGHVAENFSIEGEALALGRIYDALTASA